jgi:hypothetical protein
MTKPDITVNSYALTDATVVITGTLEQLTRKEAEELVVEAGGKVAKTVTKNTTLLIAGEKAGSKLAKAKELEVPIRREKDLIEAVDIINCGLKFYPVEAEKDHEPDWEDELVTGDALARCAQQLLSKYEPEDIAPLLGYKYMDGKGHDQPLPGHLMKAIEDAGVDIDDDDWSRSEMIDIYKGKLIKHLDSHGLKIQLPKSKYMECPQDYDHACDWEEIEDWEEYNYPEAMMEGDVDILVYVDEDMEFLDALSDEEMFEYYEIPSKHITDTCGYG